MSDNLRNEWQNDTITNRQKWQREKSIIFLSWKIDSVHNSVNIGSQKWVTIWEMSDKMIPWKKLIEMSDKMIHKKNDTWVTNDIMKKIDRMSDKMIHEWHLLFFFLKKKLGPRLVSVCKQVFMGLTLFSRSSYTWEIILVT